LDEGNVGCRQRRPCTRTCSQLGAGQGAIASRAFSGRVHAALALIGEALVVMLFLTLSSAAFAQDD